MEMLRKKKITRLCAVVWCAFIALMPGLLWAADTSLDKRSSPLTTGDMAVDFTLADQDGRKHTLSAERDKRPVVLIFYRGHW